MGQVQGHARLMEHGLEVNLHVKVSTSLGCVYGDIHTLPDVLSLVLKGAYMCK